MFTKIFLSYIQGYLKVTVEGYYIERFINICRKNNIAIWNIRKNEDVCISFNMETKEFKNVCKIAKKTKCKIKIKAKKGFPFLLFRYKKRKLFLFLLILLVFILWLSSNFIWNVEIIEQEGQNFENIEKDIEEAGLKIGTLKTKIDTKEVINKI